MTTIDYRPRSNHPNAVTARHLGSEVVLLQVPSGGGRRVADDLRDAFCAAVDGGALAVVLHLEGDAALSSVPATLVGAMADVLEARGGWLWLLTPREDGRLCLTPVASQAPEHTAATPSAGGVR